MTFAFSPSIYIVGKLFRFSSDTFDTIAMTLKINSDMQLENCLKDVYYIASKHHKIFLHDAVFDLWTKTKGKVQTTLMLVVCS